MNLDDYLKKFYVLAGSANEAPIYKDNKEYQTAFIELINSILENYIPDNIVSYYREILNYISVASIMTEMTKNPGRFWVAKSKVLDDFVSLQAVLIDKVINRDVANLEPVKLPEEVGLGDYVFNKCQSGMRINMDIATYNYSNQRFDNFGSLITAYLENYINLVVMFYQKLDEKSIEFASIDVNDLENYQSKEEHYLFFEIHNFLRKMLREIGYININDCELCEGYIKRMVRNTMVMDLLTGIIKDKTDVTNYQKYQEMEKIDSGFIFDVDSYLRKMIRRLNNQYGEGIVRS